MSTEFDVVVAGGGISGLTAGLTTATNGLSTFMLTGEIFGGNLLSIEQIDGYPGYPEGIPGYELCPMVQGQAVEAGAELAPCELLELTSTGDQWLVRSDAGEFVARAVILATGARLRELDVPGADRLKGRGVSHCASCDAPLLKDKSVAVIGGGDSALQEALTLSNFAERVLILQKGDAIVAQARYREKIDARPNVEIKCNIDVEEITGGDAVEGISFKENGADTATAEVVDGVFTYVGLEPNTARFDHLVELDETGRIIVDSAMRTNQPGIFAAGTVRSGAAGRAAAAAEDGTISAASAAEYLAGESGR